MLKLFKVFEINTRRNTLYKVDFIFQDNMIDHLRDKELVATTKPQKPINLTIDNSQFRNHWDFGMNIRHVNHFNIYILWFRMFFKDMTGYISRTLFQGYIQEVTREAFRSTIQVTICFWVYAIGKRVLVWVHKILEVWKIRNKKIIHRPTNKGQSMKHKRTCVIIQKTF